MSSATSYPASIALPAFRVREVRLHWKLIARLCIVVVPAFTALGFGHLMVGARYLAITLFLFLAYSFMRGDRYGFLSLAVGVLPAVGFMRGVFFYYGIVVFLSAGLLLWAFLAWKEFRFVWGDLTWKCMVFLSLIYWWSSIVYTGEYTSNIRLVEYLLSSTAVYLLANRRSWLATALVGVGISTTALAVGLLPYGDRLGAADIDSMHVGNPILMGVPSAMILLLALADNGRILLLENYPFGRIALALLSAEWLVLSGSRGSWAIILFGFFILLSFGKLGRKAILGFVVVIALATSMVLLSNRGEKIQAIFNKTVDSDRTLKTRTSFRSVQWAAMPEVFVKSPIWGWGPGSGKQVAFEHTGRHLAWHSLYLQVLGETGLIGIVSLFWIMGSLIRRSFIHLRKWGEVTPLIGVVAFMTLGISVSGFDALSGIFLGLAFMARESSPRMASREAPAKGSESPECETPQVS